jgi:hypothetical protein
MAQPVLRHAISHGMCPMHQKIWRLKFELMSRKESVTKNNCDRVRP